MDTGMAVTIGLVVFGVIFLYNAFADKPRGGPGMFGY